jgi:hypothetical protein
MPWFQIVLTSAQVSSGELARVREHFQMFFSQAARPGTLAMCAHSGGEGSNMRLFFSPATAELAPAFLQIERARACARPRAAVTLVVGDPRFLERLQRRGRFGLGASAAPAP